MNLTLHLMIWGVLALIVLMLALYRKRIDRKVDDMVHVLDSEVAIGATQEAVAKKIAVIDRWGKALTVLAAAYLLVIGGLYLYLEFTQETSVKFVP